MKNKIKKFSTASVVPIVILGVLLLVVIAGKDGSSDSVQYGVADDWVVYEDSAFGFSLEHPAHLERTIIDKEIEATLGTRVYDVSFHTLGPGNVGVKVYEDTPFATIDELFDVKNAESEHIRFERESSITFGNVPAVAFHTVTVSPSGQEEYFENEKKVVFIKDGLLFELWTRFDRLEDHKKVWSTFELAR